MPFAMLIANWQWEIERLNCSWNDECLVHRLNNPVFFSFIPFNSTGFDSEDVDGVLFQYYSSAA